MKKIIMSCRILALLVIASLAASAAAAPVNRQQAQAIAKQYISIVMGKTDAPALSLARAFTDDEGNATLYIFNIGDEGLILVSGDDLLRPVLGYATGKGYDPTHSNAAFEEVLNGYHQATQDMRAAQRRGVSVLPSYRAAAERAALDGNGSTAVFQDVAAKDVLPLLTTTWGQGNNYNDKCPLYSDGENGHALVGCVALAMAQVIRYHEYPAKGFGNYSYHHDYYGTQYAYFDSVTFDYSHMPDHLRWEYSDEDVDAVSQLCYYCGVSVDMNYQNPGYTIGSGAQTEDVVEGLRHFGYMNAYYLNRGTGGNALFDSLVRDNLNRGLPVICSGRTTEYGHAFVCDGYRSNSDLFHFNFGWDGYQNTYFTLDDMNGFSARQGAVFDIMPSHIENGSDTLYVDAQGTGDGTTWGSATFNLLDAIKIAGKFGKAAVFVKEGTYYGDTSGDNAVTMQNGVRLYGGFTGTEHSIDEASPAEHPTILSGQGRRRVVYCDNFNKNTYMEGFQITDGYAVEGAGALIQNNLIMRNCTFHHNIATGTKGAAFYSTGGAIIINNIVYNNTGANAVYIEEADNVKNCLIHNNDGNGLNMAGWGQVLNSTIVNNRDTGIVAYNAASVRNCIVWNNGTDIADSCTITFSAVGHQVADGNATLSELLSQGSCLLLASPDEASNNGDGTYPGPLFQSPVLTRGTTSQQGDYHLLPGSPCINSADTINRELPAIDLGGNRRNRGGRVDMGCYECQTVGIVNAEPSLLRLYPNPAHDVLNIELPSATAITIVNALGQQARTFSCAAGTTALPLAGLPRGIYLLRAGTVTAKFVVR